MAAGDAVVRVVELRIRNSQDVYIEYDTGIEDKQGKFHKTTGSSLVLSWDAFLKKLSQSGTDGMEEIWNALTAWVKADNVSVKDHVSTTPVFNKTIKPDPVPVEEEK